MDKGGSWVLSGVWFRFAFTVPFGQGMTGQSRAIER
jgi:hypothetical protein